MLSQAFVTSVAQGQTAATLINDSWTGHHALFAAILVDAWNITPTNVNTLVASLGSQFEVIPSVTSSST